VKSQTLKQPTSPGEQLVAAYLRQRRFAWEHEMEIGGRNPDFVAETPAGKVVLEVYEPELRLANGIGWFDPIEPLHGLVSGRKQKQIKAVKTTGLPLIMVVGSANSDIAFDMTSVEGLMFGRPGVRIPIGSDGGPRADAEWTFLGGVRIQPDMNTGVSAVALVQRFNPTLWRLHSAWRLRGLLGRPPASDGRELGEIYERMRGIELDLTSRGVFDPEARLARLLIAHNPFAAYPLGGFAGPHDDQWRVRWEDESHGSWERGPPGALRWEVPGDS
jgi:hypothetical protein